MSKRVVFVLVSLLVICFVGCVTQIPFSASVSFPAEKDYEILGRVHYSGFAGHATYHKLLEEAKRQFPETDDVVNIIVDSKRRNFFIFYLDSFTMSGIAIKYTTMADQQAERE